MLCENEIPVLLIRSWKQSCSPIQNRLLDNAIGSTTPIFDDRPIVMLFAVLQSSRTAKNMTLAILRQNFRLVKRLGLPHFFNVPGV
jgi:hypothetical protein